MRIYLAAGLSWIHQIALSVWLGGILVVGAVTAPAIFGTAKSQGQTEISQPLYRFAGEAMGEAFRRFNYVVLIAAVLLLLSGLGYGLMTGVCRRRLIARAGLSTAALGVAVWVTFSLYPQMVEARTGGQMGGFDQMHHTYSAAFQVQLILLLGVAALTALIHVPHVLNRSGQDSASNSVPSHELSPT